MEKAAAAAASGALEASRVAAAAALAEVEKGSAEIAAVAAAVVSAPPPSPVVASSSPPPDDRDAAAFERARRTLGSGVELPPRGGGGGGGGGASAGASEADKAPASSPASAASSLVASLMRRVTGAESASAGASGAPAAAAAPSSSSYAAAATADAAKDAAAKATDAAAAAAAASAPATAAWASSSLPWLPRRAPAAAPAGEASSAAAVAPAAAAPAGEASSAAAVAPAAAAPAAPAGGLKGLPPRPAPAPASSSSSAAAAAAAAPSSQQAEQQSAPAPPSRPAGGLGSLPPRPAGGLGALPPRGGGGGGNEGGGGGSAPSAGAAASTPAATASGGGAAGASSSSSSAAAAPASGTSAPASNGDGAGAGGGAGGSGGRGGGGPAPSSATSAAAAAAADEPADAAALRARIRSMVVLLFRLCLRLRQPPAAPIARNTLSKLAMAERIRLGNAPAGKGLDPQAAAVEAEKLEARGDGAGAQKELPLNCTVLVLGPAGAGKTSMIEGLLRQPGAVSGEGEDGAATASPPAPSPTRSVVVTLGKVAGCTLNFIDTPGLLRGPEAIRHNLKVLKGVRAAQSKHRPTMVLYVDRMDTPPRGGGSADAAMLKSVSDALGRAVWFNTILVLTHAASAPPDGASGAPLPHDAFSQNRMHLLQQGVRAAAGDARLFNPAALVDCHPRCRTDPETGNALLPSGVAWRPSLVMWCLASKLLADAEDVLHVGADKKKKSSSGAGESMQERIAAMMRGSRLPPIPHLLSKLNKGKSPVAKPDDDADVLSLGDIRKLRSEEQRAQEIRRRQDLLARRREERNREGAGSACPLYSPDPPLTPSFDEVPELAHRYRDYDEAGSWITRPFVEPTPLDHDDGIDGVQAERTSMLRRRNALLDGVPCRVFGQFQKDKGKTTVHAEAEATLTHRVAAGINLDEAVAAAEREKRRQKKLKKMKESRKGKKGSIADDDDGDASSFDGRGRTNLPRAPLFGTVTTTVGVDGMTFQRDMLYTARAETRTNVPGVPSAKAAVGVSASRLVEGGGAPTGQGPVAYGAKVDTRMGLLQGGVDAGMTLGAMTTSTQRGGRETATAGSAELDFAPEFGGHFTVGGSFMNFRKDLGLQGNLGSQWSPSVRTTVAANATLNNKGAGGLTLRVTSNDRPQLGLAFLAPVLGMLWNAVMSRRYEE